MRFIGDWVGVAGVPAFCAKAECAGVAARQNRITSPGKYLPFVKDKECGDYDKGESEAIVPFEFVAEIHHGEDREDRERDDFLNGLELCGAELIRADAVCGDLKTVFEERDPPAHHDHLPEGFATKFQVAVPRKGHEDIGDGQQ